MSSKKAYLVAALLGAVALCQNPFSAQAQVPSQEYQAQKAKLVQCNYGKPVLNEQEQKLNAMLQQMKQDFVKAHPIKTYNAAVIFEPTTWDSELYKFMREMPKGAELHLHGGAMMNLMEYIDLYASYPNVYVYPAYDDNILPKKQPSLLKYFSKESIVPAGYVQLQKALKEGIVTKEWLFDLMNCKVKPENQRMWDYFEDLSKKRVDGQTHSMKEAYYVRAMESYAARGVQHLEIQDVAWDKKEDFEKNLLTIRRAYYKVKEQYPEFTARVLVANVKLPKVMSVERTETSLMNAVELSKEILDESDPLNKKPFLVGLNLVAEEDLSRDLDQYEEVMRKVRKAKPDFKIELHAGESLLMSNDDVVDAYLLKANRIGHGINLYRFPKLIEKMKKDKVSIALCPLSNNVLEYVYDLRYHPGLEYMRRGISVQLSSDDPMKENYDGLVDDFFMTTLAWDLDLADIKLLAQNSLKNSFLTKAEKKVALEQWNESWNHFVAEKVGTCNCK